VTNEMLAALIYCTRCTVGIAFIMSAWWKLRHRAEFADALTAIVGRRFLPLRRPIQYAVPAVEAVTALALVLPGAAARLGVVAAAILLVLLTLTLLRRDLSAGCGCWSLSNPSRSSLLARNGLLLALTLAGLPSTPPPGWPTALAGAAMGGIFAVLIMEIPTIMTYFIHSSLDTAR
jgi:hypothetical protein